MFDNIKTIVFDLDGTLYQDFQYHRVFLDILLEGTDKKAWQDDLITFVDEVMDGQHLDMNAFYRSLPMEIETLPEYLEALKKQIISNLDYQTALKTNDVLYMGDIWSVITLIGATLGIFKTKVPNDVYFATRMIMETYTLPGNTTLYQALLKAKERFQTVLLSNSQPDAGSRHLNILGFEGAFSEAVYHAQKPGKLLENLEKVFPGVTDEPETILTIGDHAFNDLIPIQAIGGKAIWMNPFPNFKEPQYDLTFSTLEELAEFLNTLGCCK